MKIALEIERGYERGDIKQALANAADEIDQLLAERKALLEIIERKEKT